MVCPAEKRIWRRLAAAAVLVTMVAAMPGRADDDHVRARAARQAGEIRPLEEIMAAAKRDNPGEVVAVELEREHGRWIYEVKILSPQGDIRRLDYDARSGERLPSQPRGRERRRQ